MHPYQNDVVHVLPAKQVQPELRFVFPKARFCVVESVEHEAEVDDFESMACFVAIQNGGRRRRNDQRRHLPLIPENIF